MKFRVVFVVLVLLFSCKKRQDQERGHALQTSPKVETTNHSITIIENPSHNNSHLPRLFSDGQRLYFSWVTRRDSTDQLNYSVLANGSWKEALVVSEGNDWFTNWADFPAIAANERGDLLTSFLQKSADGTYTYDIKLNHYNAATDTWKKNFILHNDGTKSEHGFVSMRPYAANSFLVTWLDGRDTVDKKHGEGQMTLRAALVFEDGTIAYDTLLDARVCDCCQTASAIGVDDQILVAYRDRSDDEVRDISITQWTKEKGWNSPKTVGQDNWKIAGCPVNGPSIDALGNSLAVAWFTANKGEGDVKVVFSVDGGKTFTRPFHIDSGNATGRVDIVMLNSNEAAIAWMQPNGEEEAIYLMKINRQGVTGKPVIVSKTSSERGSGFPQLEKVGRHLYLAWTQSQKKQKQIITAKIAIEDLY